MLTVDRPADMKAHVGEDMGASDWLTVDQAMIDKFLSFGTTAAPRSGGASTTPVTAVAPAPPGEAPIYNNKSEPYDVAPC